MKTHNNLFKYLIEEKIKKSCAKFIFMTGNIIVKKGKFKDYTKVKIVNKDINIEPSQKGPVVCIYNNKDINSIHTIPSTMEFMQTDPEGIYAKYLSLIGKGLK